MGKSQTRAMLAASRGRDPYAPTAGATGCATKVAAATDDYLNGEPRLAAPTRAPSSRDAARDAHVAHDPCQVPRVHRPGFRSGAGGRGRPGAPRPRHRGNRGPPLTLCGRSLPSHRPTVPGIPTVWGGGVPRRGARARGHQPAHGCTEARGGGGGRVGVEKEAPPQPWPLVSASTHVPAAAMATTAGPGRRGGRRKLDGWTPSLRHQEVPPHCGCCTLVGIPSAWHQMAGVDDGQTGRHATADAPTPPVGARTGERLQDRHDRSSAIAKGQRRTVGEGRVGGGRLWHHQQRCVTQDRYALLRPVCLARAGQR